MFDRIHHAGIAIADIPTAKDVFADKLGLVVDQTRSPLPDGSKQRGPDPTDILDIPIGNAELEMNAPPSDGTTPGGTHRFVEQRGGAGALHHICLHSTNVPDDIAHLRAAGLQQIAASPEVLESNEPWDSVAFFHPRDCMGILLEIWFTDDHHVGARYQGEGIFTRLNHIGVVSGDLDKARHFWTNAIGMRVDMLKTNVLKGGLKVESDNVRVLNIPMATGNSGVVAITPEDGTSGTARFLEKYGGRANGTMHHLAFATKDVKTAADYVQGNGLKLIGQPNDEFAWIHPKSAAGVLIQIVKDEA
ncbi:MAG: VOC family protein [Chloroflexi bacterium]|nr:VOC family protein [Chloroflexota bacterium]